MSAPVGTVKRFYARLKAGDVPGLVELMADDIAWETMLDFGLDERGPQPIIDKVLAPLMVECAKHQRLTDHHDPVEVLCPPTTPGRPRRDQGLSSPPDPPTVEEIIAVRVVRATRDDPGGIRFARADGGALAAGPHISEALVLASRFSR